MAANRTNTIRLTIVIYYFKLFADSHILLSPLCSFSLTRTSADNFNQTIFIHLTGKQIALSFLIFSSSGKSSSRFLHSLKRPNWLFASNYIILVFSELSIRGENSLLFTAHCEKSRFILFNAFLTLQLYKNPRRTF